MFKIKRLAPALGVEIEGVDLSKPLVESAMQEILGALDREGVVLMRKQHISIDDFMRFSKGVGPLAIHSLKQYSKPGMPELMVASNIIENDKPIGLADGGQHWHTDGSYLEKPYRATILHAIEVPMKDGVALGDTMFASTGAAYDALEPDMQQRLSELRALNCHGVARNKRGKDLALEAGQREHMLKGVEQPVVRTHPYTGRKCLYAHRGSTARICGYDDAASDELLEMLFEHVIKPEFIYRHNWRVGDILMWDNCSTQHCAIGDYDLPLRRLLYRTVVQGQAAF